MNSNEKIEKFYKFVEESADVRKKLCPKNKKTENSMMYHIVNVARDNGFDFSINDLSQFINYRCNLNV